MRVVKLNINRMHHFFYFIIVNLMIFLFSAGSKIEYEEGNVIPFQWKITEDKNIDFSDTKLDISGWKSFNIGVSWERQGYFYGSGSLVIASTFEIPKNIYSPDSRFKLTVNLQGKVKEVWLNGIKVSDDISFKKSMPSSLDIMPNQILMEEKNLILIKIDKVSWTGGTCDNIVKLTHPVFGKKSAISLISSSPNATYRINEPLKIKLLSNNNFSSNYKLQVISDFNQIVEKQDINIASGDIESWIELDQSLYPPGFYHVMVSSESPYFVQKDIWIAIEPEAINCRTSVSSREVKKFWNNAIDELNKIPTSVRVKKMSIDGIHSKDVYEVSYQSLENVKIYGYLFVPRKEGKYPAILHVPGYAMSYSEHSFLDNKDNVIDFALNIRGHGKSIENINPGFGLTGFVGYQICSAETYVYRGAYMDCVRAIDFLRDYPQVESSKIGVTGGSQGGGLALATAALVGNKIKACVALCPFLSDLEHHALVRTVFQLEKEAIAKTFDCEMSSLNNSLNMVDTKNMVSRIKASVFFGTGLFDDDCPSHVGFATYNKIKSKKEYKIYPKEGHLLKTGDADGRKFLRKELQF